MLYNYIFFKLYKWSRRSGWYILGPQGALTLLTLSIFYNAYLILFLLDLFKISRFDSKYIYSPTAKILIVVFVSMYLYNNLHFYWINKWKEIVIYFNNNEASSKIRLLSNTYIIFSVVSFLIISIYSMFFK